MVRMKRMSNLMSNEQDVHPDTINHNFLMNRQNYILIRNLMRKILIINNLTHFFT